MRSIFISFCVSVNWLFRIIQQIPPEEGNSIKLVLRLDFINRSFSRFNEERKKGNCCLSTVTDMLMNIEIWFQDDVRVCVCVS